MKLAAIDIGSNAVRLIINRVLSEDGGQLKRLEFVRIPLRLGDDVFQHGMISKEKEALLTKTIQAFALIMEVHHINDYMACATSAMRDSVNGSQVAARIEKKTGIKINIIDGMEESRLILDAVMRFFPEHGNFINIDVGGGSTEMTLIRNHRAVASETFNIGTVRLLYETVDSEEWKRMEKWLDLEVDGLKNLIAVGTGGNINKALRMLDIDERDAVSYDKLKTLHQVIKGLTLKERIYKLKLNPDRADVLEPALKIHLQIMKWAAIKKIYAPNAGLKDGIIRQLLDRNHQEVSHFLK